MQAFNPNTINFTDQAILHFTNALSGKPDEFAIRIGVREAGCSGYEYFFESGLNQGIVFKNPNAKVTCGCGESFSV
jgi:Fe-S cluster assembly iron-binding protein IscA